MFIITVPTEKVERAYPAERGSEWRVRFRPVLPGEAREGWRRGGARFVAIRAGLEVLSVTGLEVSVKVGGKVLTATDPAAAEAVLLGFPDLADAVASEAERLGDLVEDERGNLPGAPGSLPS